MGDIILKVEDLSKQYRLGLVGTGSLKDDLQRFWAKMRGKEDPLSKVGETNQLDSAGGDFVWALQDINFEVSRGEVLGIIGKNGAGKSTLLKILSKVTGPSRGNIYVNGRIASLLEVGTGFHPELTGRENIFLNGAILGMMKRELKSKLDEIVDFAGVDKYLDTPVKRYSSGMYVRLAFAVAAHLEPEILIVDEVLAVGDVEFQKKAIGKMQDVSKGQGRTVLFVSHNMGAVQKLCDRCLLLSKGNLVNSGQTTEIINNYLNNGIVERRQNILISNEYYEIKDIAILNEENIRTNMLRVGEKWMVTIIFEVKQNIPHFIIALGLSNDSTPIRTGFTNPKEAKPGFYKINFYFDDIEYSEGNYYFSLGISSFERVIGYSENCFSFSRSFGGKKSNHRILRTKGVGVIITPVKYDIQNYIHG